MDKKLDPIKKVYKKHKHYDHLLSNVEFMLNDGTTQKLLLYDFWYAIKTVLGEDIEQAGSWRPGP